MSELLVTAIVACGAAVGILVGLGGAVLIVPALVSFGMQPVAAAAIGLLSVASASAAAAPEHLRQRNANHRLSVTLEVGATAGAVAGALLLPHIPDTLFRSVLLVAVVLAGIGILARRGTRNHPDPALTSGDLGERPGTLAGAYLLGEAVVPYHAVRVRTGIALATGIGVVAGMSGTSGGYLKTPLMSEVMHVPVKVAAASTSFASGLTAVAGLAVLLPRGALELELAAGVVAAALLGGFSGGKAQKLLPPPFARYLLAGLLVVVVATLLVGYA